MRDCNLLLLLLRLVWTSGRLHLLRCVPRLLVPRFCRQQHRRRRARMARGAWRAAFHRCRARCRRADNAGSGAASEPRGLPVLNVRTPRGARHQTRRLRRVRNMTHAHTHTFTRTHSHAHRDTHALTRKRWNSRAASAMAA